MEEKEFNILSLDDKCELEKIIRNNPMYSSLYDSESTFENILTWSACDRASALKIDEGVLVLYNFDCGKKVFYPPYVYSDEMLIPAIRKTMEYSKKHNMQIDIERMPENMANYLVENAPNEFDIIDNRDAYEYLYDPTEFIGLVGKRFSSKRNFLNGFISAYNYEFLDFEPYMRQDINEFVEQWAIGSNNLDDYKCELSAINKSLDLMKDLDICCDCLYVDKKLVAFAIGFINIANVGIVMFEKADTAFRGSYVAINNMFAAKHFAKCKYINRQEDMGIEGLRKAKLSYCPVAFAKKYILKCAQNR